MNNETNNTQTNADQPTTEKVVAQQPVAKKGSWKRWALYGTAGVAVLAAGGAAAFALLKGKGAAIDAATAAASLIGKH